MVLAFLLKTACVEDEKAPKIIILNKDISKIGRKSEICVDTTHGKEISKRHCTIYHQNKCGLDSWVIEDNNSLNGTFVNKRKIHRVFLNEGDEVVFGGGSEFFLGDLLQTTDKSCCRYMFFIPFPPVKFLSTSDPNRSICPSDECDQCPICMGALTNPETLPCHHTFCLHCIRKWADSCTSQYRVCTCPLCRAKFQSSSLRPDEAIITNDNIQVVSTEPFLRDVNMTSCKKVRAYNIFKKWTPKEATTFWEMFKSVKENRIRCAIFLHLTKLTMSYIFTAKKEDLQQAVENLTGKRKDEDASELSLELLKILELKFMPRGIKHPLPQKKAKIRRYYYY